MGGLRELVQREEDWLLVGWLVKEGEQGIEVREGHCRNSTIPCHSCLGLGWERE